MCLSLRNLSHFSWFVRPQDSQDGVSPDQDSHGCTDRAAFVVTGSQVSSEHLENLVRNPLLVD
jgi:hypothetical protein